MRLLGAMIFAKDMDKMAAFYRDGFGLEPEPEASQRGWIQFDAGSVTFALHAIPKALADGIEIGDPPRAREGTPIKLVFATADLAATRAHLAACGATLSEPIVGVSCDGWDPEGNVFHIVER